MADNKKAEVTYKVTQQDVNENESLAGFFDPEQGLVVYNLNDNLTGEFADELTKLLGSEKINVREVATVSPIILAVNELQQVKLLQYEPEIDEDQAKAVGDKFGVDIVINPEDYTDVTYDLRDETPLDEVTQTKLHAAMQKLVDKAHDEAYQDYKDAKKLLGQYKKGLTESKRLMKAPAKEFMDSVEAIFKLFAGEYDNTYKAINSSFDEALKVEADRKKAAEAKKQAAVTQKMQELSDKNAEMAAKMDNQDLAMRRAQVYNAFKYQAIGTIQGKILTQKHQWTIEYLEQEKARYEALAFEKHVADSEYTMEMFNELEEDKQDELVAEFEKARASWVRILGEEITNRGLKKQVQSYQDSQELPDLTSGDVTEPAGQSEDELFLWFIEQFEGVQQQMSNLQEAFGKIQFTEEPHAKKQEQILSHLFPVMAEQFGKTQQFIRNHYENYTNYKNQNQNG